MSSQNGNKKRGVRFTEESIANGSERVAPPRYDDDDDDDDDDEPVGQRHKRPRQDRPNPDELDDLDDYVADDDSEIPSESQTLRAKQERRLKVHDDDEADDTTTTRIDNDTSLAAEGIAIEPFHMNQENSDGTGYFNGDTYIFRRGGNAEEPDAWLESMTETVADELIEAAASAKARSDSDDDDEERNTSSGNKMDNWTEQELYAQIIPFVSDSETIMRAIARYGNLLKRRKEDADTQLAKKALNDLTEAASALLLRGQHDIYQKTRKELTQLLSDKNDTTDTPQASAEKLVVQWEYQGSQDQQIHGPYTTQEMQGWIQQGYFIGPSAVMVRSIRQNTTSEKDNNNNDLLSDLLEDDDDGDSKPPSTTVVKGEWIRSDQVDFSKYA